MYNYMNLMISIIIIPKTFERLDIGNYYDNFEIFMTNY